MIALLTTLLQIRLICHLPRRLETVDFLVNLINCLHFHSLDTAGLV